MKYKKPKIKGFSNVGDSFNAYSPMRRKLNRLMLLDNVWQKEVGPMADHWVLEGVDNSMLCVRITSPVAEQELNIRKTSLIRNLNKYFDEPWIKGVKKF